MVGATREEVAQLEEYGVIAGRDSLGERVFDDDAVATTKWPSSSCAPGSMPATSAAG